MNISKHTPLVSEPFPRPQRWGDEEIALLTQTMRQQSLFYWKGPQTEALYPAFRAHYPLKHLFPCSSGTASVHIAFAALRLKPGDEVIVPAITDMGSVIGILHQQLVPVFADIDPQTFNIDPVSVRAAITPKTRAILAVHLCGNACDMAALQAIAREHHLALVEDAAQAWGTSYQGTYVGLMGDLGCWSFNDFKHLSCGDGGMVGTNRDDLGAHLSKWGDKCYNRITGIRNPDELAYNYRMSEPLSAICVAQLGKHDAIIAPRVRNGDLLTRLLAEAPGVRPQVVRPGDVHTYYNYIFRLKLFEMDCRRTQFATALQAEGVNAHDGYLPDPVYRYDLFQNHNFYAGTWPIRDFGLTTMDYTKVVCPVAETFLKDCIHLPFNEAMSEDYITKVAFAITTVAQRYAQ
ncbi:MAG: DegT/DnrJ/EryC1/StrS family aminotransferase [Cephaloticoccus sp.]|nr:DegT/DnrJ/EryC1/StrS family aminotransferase [Cephaloticoccus sp.]MCF7759576.1 DegT/DnrJ/EryC1/StrS family aminotransferase [Cephaloticoccus sp.]